MYKTVVIGYTPVADSMAEKIEEKSNEMLGKGYELITMAITGWHQRCIPGRRGC